MKTLDLNIKREIDIKNASDADLVSWFNDHSDAKPIKSFKDRAEAEAKVAELKQALIELKGGSSKPGAAKEASKKASASSKKDNKKSSGSKKADAKKGKVPAAKGKTSSKSTETSSDKGRKSEFAGKFIYKKTDTNPRREGTHGFNSFALIKNGMTYEAYIAAGGRPNDLRWDLDREWVEVRDSKK